MPELPEVETIRRQLASAVVGRTVASVTVRYAGRINVGARTFARKLTGAKVTDVGRRAKLLLIGFDGGDTLVAHLKMTGRFLLVPSGTAPSKHVHVVFKLSGGHDLFFEDTRKFGYLKLVPTGDLERKVFAPLKYGPEPLEPSFTFAAFAGCIRAHGTKRIKPLLMDQTCIAGIGNIYADEACWYAKVLPGRKASGLSDAELKGVWRGAVSSMRASLASRGTSADMYLDLYGRKGTYLPKLKVYDRQGKRCTRCGGTIVKVRLAGRGAHYCPDCQK
jgi:formamidopyrimidine-DNA glycosylase